MAGHRSRSGVVQIDKVALVTGASSGLGQAMASRLLDDGFTVYAVARRIEPMADLASRGASTMAMDITAEADVLAVADRIGAEHGGVDVVVNNAGFGSYGAMEDTTMADARYQFEVNLFGLARLTQLLLPAMRSRGSGRIVNISSMGGRIYTPMGSWYHATKHALEGWSDCLRLELKPFGVDVIVIEPGVIDTAFGQVVIGPLLERSGDSAYAHMAHQVAASTARTYHPGRGTPPSRVADVLARALASRRPRTRYMVGRYARRMVLARRWLGDRAFDRLMVRYLGA